MDVLVSSVTTNIDLLVHGMRSWGGTLDDCLGPTGLKRIENHGYHEWTFHINSSRSKRISIRPLKIQIWMVKFAVSPDTKTSKNNGNQTI